MLVSDGDEKAFICVHEEETKRILNVRFIWLGLPQNRTRWKADIWNPLCVVFVPFAAAPFFYIWK